MRRRIIGPLNKLSTEYSVPSTQYSVGVLVLLAGASLSSADEPIAIRERATAGSEFRVLTESSVEGELTADKPLKIKGRSSIDYVEKLLAVDPKEADFRAIRVYDKIEFQKTTGDRTDEMALRPAVKRVVVLKHGAKKAPFSPDGPLLWTEIDLLKRETIVPALAGILPEKAVQPGDKWKASAAAIAELTDIEKVEEGELECQFDKVLVAGPRRLAQLTFTGAFRGVNEDGPTRQRLVGRVFVDLTAECICYLKVEGEQTLLDDKANPAGTVRIKFELTRQPVTNQPGLTETALKGLTLTPTEENSALLCDNEETGLRFVHSRNWRVVRTKGRQIALEASGGTGLLITVEPPGGGPFAADVLKEALKGTEDRKVKVTGQAGPAKLLGGLDRFTLDTEDGSEKLTLDYLLVRQENGGVTLHGHIPAAQRDIRMKELEKIARSIVVVRRLDGK